MGRPPHPGKIEFVDGDTNRVLSVDDVADVPERVAWAETEDGLAPVVRVVATTNGDRRTINEYGVDGALLRTTVQVKSR